MSEVEQRPPSRNGSIHSMSSPPSSKATTPAFITATSSLRQAPASIFTGRVFRSDSTTNPIRYEGTAPITSPGSIDRVFPVRSAVSIDHTATAPTVRPEVAGNYKNIHIGSPGTIAARRATNNDRQNRSPSSSPKLDRHSGLESANSRNGSVGVPRNDGQDATTAVSRRRSSVRHDQPPSDPARAKNKVDHTTIPKILNDDTASAKSVNSVATSSSVNGSRSSQQHDTSGDPPFVTARFKHVVTDGGHAVITGRDGETLQRCEDEPIHIPGAIQSFGMLVAFKEKDAKLVVHVVSENSMQIIGYTPQQMFKLDNLLDIFSDEQADNLLDHLDFIRDEDASDVVANGPEVFMLSIRPPQHRTRKLWCAMHVCALDKDMVICEFEVEDDKANPLVPPDDDTPEPPEDTLNSEPTAEELAESTVNISRPLRVLKSARKKRGEAAAMEVFNIMSQVQEQLANAPTLPVFLKVLIGVVKELTGFHRVMIYQFDQLWNGRVVAELVDPRATKDLYKGLNFPASDIPAQARDMYKLNKVRLLYDRDQETARLVCRTVEDLEKPLDLTHAYLRAMSPIHIKYLNNMAVRSSMSISINAFNELWGLIACHAYGSKGMRVSFPIRKMCRLVGDTASRNIERLSYASRLQARKLINTTSSSQNPSGYIVASSEDLLQLFDADVGVLSIRDETKVMGDPCGHLQEVLAMVEFLRLKKLNSVYTSQDIGADFPDLRYGPGLKFLAGVMYVPLSHGGDDFIAFFRRGVLQEVKWAGNPYEKYVKEGTEGYLEPRKSFKQWSEMIVGRCRDWAEETIETASVLCLVYGKFIEVWRQKEAALQSSQLTKLLLANSAHEVRTPLNAIINYLEIALEGSLDQETRENLAKSHSASKSLVYVINDLLDLTKAEEHQNLIKDEVFDLHHTLREATDPFAGDAKRKNISYSVNIDTGIPQKVLGDHRRLRQLVSNLIANAVQHTSSGGVKIEAWQLTEQSTQARCEVEISVEDTGSGMSQEKVDALFRELEEVSYERASDNQGMLESPPFQAKVEDSTTTLGLGLAVVARTIRNMNGQLRLKTEEGAGSRFTVCLGFELAKGAEDLRLVGQRAAAPLPENNRDRTPKSGEVTLVNRNSPHITRPTSAPPAQVTRKSSMDSMRSMNSLASMRSGRSAASVRSNRSDADRLIDAIQEPLEMVSSPGHSGANGDTRLSRSTSVTDRFLDAARSPQKAKSIGSTREVRHGIMRIPGQEQVRDSGIPLRPVRVPEVEDLSRETDRKSARGVMFEELASPEPIESKQLVDDTWNKNFSVLVAEDDPINRKIMRKRLEKLGHTAHMTVNGEECATQHGEQPQQFDAVLMDLQMPIVDGFTSTKMIRSFEKTQSTACLSPRAALNGRIPIFAVSASLTENQMEKYVDLGFDGWILKPVDFKRVDQLLKGIVDDAERNSCIYQAGKWEQGGWFRLREDRDTQYEASTEPNQQNPTAAGKAVDGADDAPDGISPDETDGSITPMSKS